VVILFTALLFVSIVGMMSLLLIKRYELNSGRIFLASSRPAIGDFFYRKMMWIEYVLPGLIRVGLRRLGILLLRLWHVWLAYVVVKLERGLEQALSHVRHTTTPRKHMGQGTSAFLRQVAEHKKKLQDENPDTKGTVLEE
jgi:hypothetical protein